MSPAVASDPIDLLERIQKQDGQNRRRAILAAWSSVGLATVMLASLVVGARAQLAGIAGERDQVQKKLDALRESEKTAKENLKNLNTELTTKRAELAEVQSQRVSLTQTLGQVPQAQRRTAIEQQVKQDPRASQLRRAYLHIADKKDRGWAEAMGRKLELAGIVVPGVEFVQDHIPETTVRYSRGDQAQADQIVELLKASVKARSSELPAKYKIRPNVFEVWFAPGSRNLPP